MSNRYTQNKHQAPKNSPKPLKKFVPKNINSTTLSNSLRQSDSAGPTDSTSRVRVGESGDWASSSKIQSGDFVNYLPQEEVMAAGLGADVVELNWTPNSTTLSNSCRQSDAVGPTDSMSKGRAGESGDWVSSSKIQSGNFVNYLPQDDAVASGLGADVGGLDPVESQRVVDLLNRELSTLLKLNPRDFWRQVASDTSLHAFLESFLKFRSRWYDFPYHGAQGIVAGVIVGEYELSRRVFMVLYRISSNRDPGARATDSLSLKDHAVLLQEKQLLDLPKLLDICAIYFHENEDLTRLLVLNAMKAQPSIHNEFTAVVSHVLGIVHTMHQRCSSSLEVLFSTLDCQEHGSSQLREDYVEVIDFINDTIISMDAFVSAYKHAAVLFSCPVELSYGNEEMLSTLAKLHDSLLPSLQRGFRVLFTAGKDGCRDNRLSNIIISLKMLSTRIVKFGWKLLYFCYLSDEVFEESFILPSATKILPAKVEDPVIRADILVQTFREISEGYSLVQEGQRRTFIQNIEKDHKIMSRIELLQTTGWILMDDEQFQFLSGIMMPPLETKVNELPYTPMAGTSNRLSTDEEGSAIAESKISQIKDIFPNYGKGFLTACLEIYNQNPEEVIQRILEGTLHEDLQNLDTSLEKLPPPKTAPSLSRYDKGKGKLVESAEVPSTKMLPLVREQQIHGSSFSSTSSSGRYVRKSSSDLPDSEVFNSRDEKTLAKTAALISQLEYEDEYDDSFDDLGLIVADSGLDEIEETEKWGGKNSNMERSRETETGSAAPNASNSKWNSRKKPQFYVKDGKNYSYKVEGSVAVANYKEASLVNLTQKEQIHGLGRGGNLPLGAAERLTESNEEEDEEPEVNEVGGRGSPGSFRGRGRRGGGGRNNHHRKDRALRKQMTGFTSH